MGQALVLYRRKSEKFRIFHEATRLNDIEKLEKLLDEGISASCQDEKGRTPLHHAADLGLLEMLAFLLERGAQSNLVDVDQNTAMHSAVLFWNEFSLERKEQIVEMLLDAGAQCNSQNKVGRTPLHYAAAWNQKHIVRLLKESGAQMNILDEEGKTPLCWAIDKNRDDIWPILTQGGAWLYKQDSDNCEKITIFLGPTKRNPKSIYISIYLKKLVQRRIQNQLGNLAPQGSMENWNIQIVKMLLQHGARPCEREDVESMLLLAFSYLSHATFQLLFDAGCLLHLVSFDSNVCGTVYQLAQNQARDNRQFVEALIDSLYEEGIMKPSVAEFITQKTYKPSPLKTLCRIKILKSMQGRRYEDVQGLTFQNKPLPSVMYDFIMGQGKGTAQRMPHPFTNL